MTKRWMYILLLIPLLSSCESLFFDEEYDGEDPYVSYDYLWDQVDRHYSYFEVKNLDWNALGAQYRTEIFPGISQDSLFRVMGKLMTSLRDDHSNLRSSFNVAAFRVRLDGPDNFDFRIVEDYYIGRNYYSTGPFLHNWIANGQIGYIRLGAFTGGVNAVNLNFIFGSYASAKGLIIDLRENGGGVINDMHKILARMVDQNTVIYYSRIRNGKDHNDFSDLEPAIISPYSGPRFTNKPIMLLVDRGTFSAGSFTALSAKSLVNVKLVGDTTGGGLGLPNGGYLPNGWFYRFSVSQALSNDQAARLRAGLVAEINAENYENGVPPDITARLDRTDLTKDEIIEKAISEILK